MSLLDFSSPSPVDGYYDVFLSFRGKETRNGFTTNLYHALRKHQIHAFMDIELLGEEIEYLFDVIAQSRMAVVIYSKEFASSHWCLRELEMILQRRKEQKMILTPILYKVDRDEVKDLTGQTAKDLNKHLAKHGERNVETWKVAVANFGKVCGLSYKDNDSRSEHDFIEIVIDKIKKKLGKRPSSSDQGALNGLIPGQPEGLVADKQAFTYGEILKITNNLEKRIAQGGLGDVYSGKLNGAAVAVKIFPRFLVQKVMNNLSHCAEEYQRKLLQFRHENLVSLVGYCFDGQNVAHINEFMENGSLRYHLSGVSPRFLTWKERLKIAIDIAEGLQYLHGTNSVTHGNLQTTDILFNEKMTAKILYFPSGREAASTSTYDRYITSLIVDGAFFMSQNPLLFNKKLDLHSFAMILYELVTGHAPPALTTWQNFVINLSQGNLTVDSRLVGAIDSMSIQRVIQLAFTCAHMQNFMIPHISYVLETLKGQS